MSVYSYLFIMAIVLWRTINFLLENRERREDNAPLSPFLTIRFFPIKWSKKGEGGVVFPALTKKRFFSSIKKTTKNLIALSNKIFFFFQGSLRIVVSPSADNCARGAPEYSYRWVNCIPAAQKKRKKKAIMHPKSANTPRCTEAAPKIGQERATEK